MAACVLEVRDVSYWYEQNDPVLKEIGRAHV